VVEVEALVLVVLAALAVVVLEEPQVGFQPLEQPT
jgi:hypothetical protein